MGRSPHRTVHRAVLQGAKWAWHDLRFKDLHRSSEEFELTHRAMGFAALALLTMIPLLIVIAAASPAPHGGLAPWVIYGMGLTGSSSKVVTLIFSAPARVLGATSVFSALLLAVSGVMFAGSVQAGLEKIWSLPAGPWHKIWRQLVWLAVLTAYIYAEATVGTAMHGGLAATAAVAVVLGIPFFWWGPCFLLGGRVGYRAAVPGAVATIAGLSGLRVFSTLVFEPLIASNAASYGALGTVLIVQSWLIGVGWVIYGGQLFGRWFHDAWLRSSRQESQEGVTGAESAGGLRDPLHIRPFGYIDDPSRNVPSGHGLEDRPSHGEPHPLPARRPRRRSEGTGAGSRTRNERLAAAFTGGGGAGWLGAHVVADAGHDVAELVQVLVGQGVEQQAGDLDVAGHDPAQESAAVVGDGDQGGAFVVGARGAGDKAGLLQQAGLVGQAAAAVDDAVG